MKKNRFAAWLVPGLAVLAVPAMAQSETELAAARVDLETTNAPINRVRVSYRMSFNVDAKFKSSGNFVPQSNPGPATGGGIDRSYVDGYVNRDSAGDNHPPLTGVTWNWGYDYDGQVPGNDTLVMHGLSSDQKTDSSDDPQHGMEIMYSRQLGALGDGFWGIEAGWGWTDFVFDSGNGSMTLLSDTYQLGGVVPPPAPYRGDYNGPGPLIDDQPSSREYSSIPFSGDTKWNVNFQQWKLGPYYELPMKEKYSAYVSAGVAMAYVTGKLRYHQSATIYDSTLQPLGTYTKSGKSFDDAFLFGPYVNASFSVLVAEDFTLFVGAQFQSLSDFYQNAGGRSAKLDMSEAVFVNLGFGYDF